MYFPISKAMFVIEEQENTQPPQQKILKKTKNFQKVTCITFATQMEVAIIYQKNMLAVQHTLFLKMEKL